MSAPHSPKGLRISDEVHTALRVRAAQTGETMGEIAERALRKELGMMDRYNCYACDGDYEAGFWLDADGEDVFYCVSCAVEAGAHDSPHARPEGDVVIWQAWLHDNLMGEGATEGQAIEAAVAEYERSVGYGDEPHLYSDRGALVVALDVSIKQAE